MSKIPKLNLILFFLILLLLQKVIVSNAQVRPIKVPSIIIPPGGGGGGGGGGVDPTYAPFTCNLINPNPCNLILNNGFIKEPPDPSNPNDPLYNAAPFTHYINFWTSSHGTPQLNINLPLIAANTNHTSMWTDAQIDVNNNLLRRGEGIAIGIPKLTINNTYSLSLFKRFEFAGGSATAQDVDDFYVVLLKCSDFQSLRRFGEDYTIPDIPTTGAQVIYHETDVNNTSWSNVTQTFVANDQYDVVWIFPKNSTTAPGVALTAWLEIALPQISDLSVCAPPPCTPPTISASGPLDQCVFYEWGFLTFTTNITSNIQWYNNGNIIPGATAQTYTENNNPGSGWPTSTGTYYVKNTLTGCTSNILTATRRNYTTPYPSFQSPSQYCKNVAGTISQQQSISDPNTIYRWKILDPSGNDVTGTSVILGANNSNSYQTSISFSNYPFTTATIIMNTTDNGCTNDFWTPYTVTIDQTCLISNTPAQKNTNSNKIYPNPSTNQTTIVSSEPMISIEISDFMNPTLKKIMVKEAKSISINVSDLKPGIYNCKITTSKGVENQKLIIKR